MSIILIFQGINKELAYSIKGGDEKFSIDSNGNVIVNGSLDREKKDTFHFEVVASSRCLVGLKKFEILERGKAMKNLLLVVISDLSCFSCLHCSFFF